MNHHFTFLFCVVLLIAFVITRSVVSSPKLIAHKLDDDDVSTSLDRPAARTLKSIQSEDGPLLLAFPDGMIHFKDENSDKILWSLSTGPSLYSVYRDENGKFDYIDIGNETGLYWHTKLGSRMDVPITIEQFIGKTPLITEEGGVLMGHKETTVFLVDANSGRLKQTYAMSKSSLQMKSDKDKNFLSTFGKLIESGHVEQKNVERPLFVTRTDFTLEFYPLNSNKSQWRLSHADFKAVLHCSQIDSGSPFATPLPCPSEVSVKMFIKASMLSSTMECNESLESLHENVMPLSGQIYTPQRWLDKYLGTDNHIKLLPLLPSEPKNELGNEVVVYHQPPTEIENFGTSEIVCHQPPAEIENSGISEIVHQLPAEIENSETSIIVHQPPAEIGNPGTSEVLHLSMSFAGLSMFSTASAPLYFVLAIITFVGFVVGRYVVVRREKNESDKQSSNSHDKTPSSKRKKNRKSSKSASAEKNDPILSSENEHGSAYVQSDSRPFFNLNKFDGDAEARRIGKLCVSGVEIAKGSNGTVVLEGIFEGRSVAVKRLVQTHHDVALKEIQNLIASDRHPNIVRWYGVEYDQDFVYLSLERCTCSLDDLIQICSESSLHGLLTGEQQILKSMIEYHGRLNSLRGTVQDVNLWKANGHASPLLLQLMRDMVSGLVHLHELGIIHRDLKPQNVLIIKGKYVNAKLSDMGISRRLLHDMSSLGQHATGCGSSGWQAPEQLLHGRQTRAVDLFSLGCVLFFCITGGKHPFGDRLERDINIVKNQVDLFLVESIPEAVDLFSHLLNPDPELRPKTLEVLYHPFFWSAETRLSFLRDTSDRVELEDRGSTSDILNALESIAPMALGGKWDDKMQPAFINNIGRYRRYKYDSVRDLLRVMRNKLSHYRELPIEIQELLGTIPEGFYEYFSSRFPKLLIEVYKVIQRYCMEDDWLQKYIKAT